MGGVFLKIKQVLKVNLFIYVAIFDIIYMVI